jgi:hypothetical protein
MAHIAPDEGHMHPVKAYISSAPFASGEQCLWVSIALPANEAMRFDVFQHIPAGAFIHSLHSGSSCLAYVVSFKEYDEDGEEILYVGKEFHQKRGDEVRLLCKKMCCLCFEATTT